MSERPNRWRSAARCLAPGCILVATLLVLAPGCGGTASRKSPEVDLATRTRMAQAYVNAGRLQEARAVLEETVRKHPEHTGIWNFYGQVLFLMGRYGEAERALKRALELDPNLSDAHNNLGTVYQETGRLADAEAEYLQALKDPTYATPEKVYLNLGLLYQAMGRDEEALRMLRKAVEQNPRYYKAHYELAALLERIGRLDEAVREYEVAAPGFKDSPEFHYRLGFLYFRQGAHARAAEHLRKVQELAPGSENAAKAADLLNVLGS